MREAKIYVKETDAGKFKAYAVGFKDVGKDKRYRVKTLPDQPLRGYETKEEAVKYVMETFGTMEEFMEWAEETGNGSLLLSDVSEDEWEEVLLPDGKSSKKHMKKTRKTVQKEDAPESNMNIVPHNAINMPTSLGVGIPIETRKETITHDQYKQLALGIAQQFENTLVTCMMYNVYLNPTNLVHAYRALKLVNVLQWTAALEAARLAASQDNTWISFRDSIMSANKMIGLPA